MLAARNPLRVGGRIAGPITAPASACKASDRSNSRVSPVGCVRRWGPVWAASQCKYAADGTDSACVASDRSAADLARRAVVPSILTPRMEWLRTPRLGRRTSHFVLRTNSRRGKRLQRRFDSCWRVARKIVSLIPEVHTGAYLRGRPRGSKMADVASPRGGASVRPYCTRLRDRSFAARHVPCIGR